MFGVRTVTIAQWAREGKIAYRVTPGGHRRYPRQAIQELLDSDQEGPGTPPGSAVGIGRNTDV